MKSAHANILPLDGKHLTLDQLSCLADGARVSISEEAKKRIHSSRAAVETAVEKREPTYGVNSGFGYFANTAIDCDSLKQLQVNILRSHASGWGTPLSKREARLAMVLRLNVLAKGYTGVRLELCEALETLINSGATPVIPEHGSVGASGDLAPLAHLALPLIGEGELVYEGRRAPSKEILEQLGLPPVELKEKEGLSLVNGTQIMLAVGSLALTHGLNLLDWSDKCAALSFEGLEGRPTVLTRQLHLLRGQKGQLCTAERIMAELEGSRLHHLSEYPRLQDPYSLRCAPQVHGASRDALEYARSIIERELNAATDNPLVLDNGEIVSGGNFHGQPLAMALDIAAIALAELGNVSERRLELLLNPNQSKLPAFLSPNEGLCSGYMAAQYLSASLVNANKGLANPACTDSIPGNVGIEDHVSMGMTSARKLRTLVENLQTILTVELLTASQAIDLRGVQASQLGSGTKTSFELVREKTPTLTADRILSEEIEQTRMLLNP